MRKAVIDVGSNSVLLTVEEHLGGPWLPICETSEVTALGEGTKSSGVLSQEGMGRTLDALRRAYERAKTLHCESILALATMAARIAQNTPDFLARAESQGTPVRVLSGELEAQLGFRAVVNDQTFATHLRVSIIDVGGHSTELVMANRKDDGWDVDLRQSFPVGTLGLRDGILSEESLAPGTILTAIASIDDSIGAVHLHGHAGHAIALGATGTNLVSIREQMKSWDPGLVHGRRLSYEEISRAVSRLGAMTDAQRRALPGLEPGRERTIHIGAMILERFLHAIRADGCSVSVRGWRHAILEEGLPESA